MNKISEIEPGTSVCHFTLNRGLNRFWRAHTRRTTYTPTHTHSHISCGVTSPAHASQGGSFSTLASRANSDFHRQRLASTQGRDTDERANWDLHRQRFSSTQGKGEDNNNITTVSTNNITIVNHIVNTRH